MTKEVKRYISKAPKYTGQRYQIEIGGLKLFFKTIKEAQEYYEKYLK